MLFGMISRRLEGQRLGVGRYLEYLIKYWPQQLKTDERMALFLRRPAPPCDGSLPDALECHCLPSRFGGLTWENLILPRALGSVDVLFCPNYSAPLLYRGKTVVAIHSVNELAPGAHGWSYQFTYKPLYRRSALMADAVIVPCESTKVDAMQYYGLPEHKIHIVEQGADPAFAPYCDAAARSATRLRYLGRDVPYVLFVGKLSLRRNIPALIAAFARVKCRRGLPHMLLLLGPNHTKLPLDRLAQEHGIAGSVIQLDGDFADHKELVPIYNGADLFVHPSLYEGFSMTTVEALTCGVPVIATDRGGLRDVAREGAFMVADPTVEALSEAIEQVLTSESLQAELRAKAVKKARRFRWDTCARQTLDVLRAVG